MPPIDTGSVFGDVAALLEALWPIVALVVGLSLGARIISLVIHLTSSRPYLHRQVERDLAAITRADLYCSVCLTLSPFDAVHCIGCGSRLSSAGRATRSLKD